MATIRQTLRDAIRQELPSRPQTWYLAVDVLRLSVAAFVTVGVFAYGPHEAWALRALAAVGLAYSIGAVLLTARKVRMPWLQLWLPWIEAFYLAALLLGTGGSDSPYLRLLVLHSIGVTFAYGSLVGAMVSAALSLLLVLLGLHSPMNPIEGLMILVTIWGGYSALSLLNSAATRAYREAQAQTNRAQELQSLTEAKYQFINIVSHELRTPLTVINGYGKLLRSGLIGTTPDELQDVAREISKAADRMGLLIDELLDFGRLQSGQLPMKPERFQYDELVQDVVRVMGVLAAEREQHLSLSLSPRPVAIQADSRRIEQVLINLLHNALKYCPEGTEVRVAVRLEGDRVLTEVADEGPGITPDHQVHLFTPFYRAGIGNHRVDVEGVGLGLAICQGIVAAHGGHIGVESTPGKGSRFWFELPLARMAEPLPLEI